jgi:FAD/FMN-containing dehydrogenase
MSKVAQYLNEHLLGEVTTKESVRDYFSTDASVLTIKPDMVIYPRTTSDIRKVARFSWQLAEKGHKLSITARGSGSDQTGAAIGSGVIVNLKAHMNEIFELDVKQKLVRVQPGVTFAALNQALRLQGFYIPSYPASLAYSTIGGAIANNSSGVLSGKHGSTMYWVKQLEIVLSNGEILQTGRLNKKEVERKKGLQTFEGEIYRGVDNLITDNDSLLDSIAIDIRDNVGYNIVDVKHRDGSVDLTPLFVGAQGTLGIISEAILRVEPIATAPLVCAIAFPDYESARDGIDLLRPLDPAIFEYIDGRLLKQATDNGNHYPFYTAALEQSDVAVVVVLEFDDAKAHAKKRTAKKIAKMFENKKTYVVLEDKLDKAADLQTIGALPTLSLIPEKSNFSDPGALYGAFVPPERFEDFGEAVKQLEAKYSVELPLTGHAMQSVYGARLLLDMGKPTERHKVLKLLAEWSVIVAAHGGHLIGEACEGRLKAIFAYKELDKGIPEMYVGVRSVFDPLDFMNTGVKQVTDLKKLVDSLRSDYRGTDFADYAEGN